MLRNGATRLALRAVPAPAIRPAASFRPAAQWATQFSSLASKRPQTSALAQLKPVQIAMSRRALTQDQKDAEKRYAREELKPTPETVSATSSIHPIMGEVGQDNAKAQDKGDVSSGVKADLVSEPELFFFRCQCTDYPRIPSNRRSIFPRFLDKHTTLVLPAYFPTLQRQSQPSRAPMRSTTRQLAMVI